MRIVIEQVKREIIGAYTDGWVFLKVGSNQILQVNRHDFHTSRNSRSIERQIEEMRIVGTQFTILYTGDRVYVEAD